MSVNQLDDLDLDGEEPLEADFVLPTKEADEPAPDPEAEPPTETVEEEDKAGTDPETRAIELEFELGTLKDQLDSFKDVRDFLEDAKNNPAGVLGTLAERDPRFAPAVAAMQGQPPSTGQPQGKADWNFAKEYDEDTEKIIGGIKNALETEVGSLRSELAQLKADIGTVKPHFEQARVKEESDAKASATVARVLGVQKLIDLESESRNYGWKPTKEQLSDFARKNPDVLNGATDAKAVAKAVVEKLRLQHFDDIMNARSAGKGKPDGSNRAVVKTGDSRGATSEYDSARARAGRFVHSGD